MCGFVKPKADARGAVGQYALRKCDALLLAPVLELGHAGRFAAEPLLDEIQELLRLRSDPLRAGVRRRAVTAQAAWGRPARLRSVHPTERIARAGVELLQGYLLATTQRLAAGSRSLPWDEKLSD